MNDSVYLVNGKASDRLSVADRAVQFGDGLFETFRINQGRVPYLPRHMTRLREGCRRLQLGGLDFVSLQEQIRSRAQQTDAGVLKLIVSRGSSARGYRVVPGQDPAVIVGLHALPAYGEDLKANGIRARVCSLRLSLQPALAGIKHLNRLEQVLARAEWDDEAIQEGLLLDTRERLVEGTMSNLFLVCNGELLTAGLQDCGVSGVMRSVIMDIARTLAIETRVTTLTPDDLFRAEEWFVCNCVAGIWPVRQIDAVGKRAIGPLTRQMMQTLDCWNDAENEHWYAS